MELLGFNIILNAIVIKLLAEGGDSCELGLNVSDSLFVLLNNRIPSSGKGGSVAEDIIVAGVMYRGKVALLVKIGTSSTRADW